MTPTPKQLRQSKVRMIATQHPELHPLGPTALAVLSLLMRPGTPPSYRDVGAHLGLSPNGVRCHMDRLRSMGLIRQEEKGRRARTTRPLVRFVPAESL